MSKVSLVARYLLAVMLVVFGLNKFLGFLPMPEYLPGSGASTYMAGLGAVGLFPILGVIYLICAALLITNKMVGLATVVIAAVAFNILVFHLHLDPANIGAGIVLTVLLVLVMIGNSSKYKGLLS